MASKEGERKMIPFDFEYYKPVSIEEVLDTYKLISKHGKSVIFLSGGTEFITFARINKISADAVIDIKRIPDCNVLEIQGDQLVIGAAVSLNMITESNIFPLLGQKVKQIADHTSRNKITIGGNMNSQLIYQESILPLLISEAKVRIASMEGDEIVPLESIFKEKIKIGPGQFLVQIFVDQTYLDLPYACIKKTRFSKVGYPVVSLAALVKNNKIRTAFSGVCGYPFRSTEIETILNDVSLTVTKRVDQAIEHLPEPIVEDMEASAEYRRFILQNVLQDTLEILELTK